MCPETTHDGLLCYSKGHLIKCEKGHHLYRIRADIYEDTIVEPLLFESINSGMPNPRKGDGVAVCPICKTDDWFIKLMTKEK